MDTDTRVGESDPQMLAHNGVLKAKWEDMSQNHAVTEQVSDRQGDRVGKIAARYVNISVRRQVFASVKQPFVRTPC